MKQNQRVQNNKKNNEIEKKNNEKNEIMTHLTAWTDNNKSIKLLMMTARE